MNPTSRTSRFVLDRFHPVIREWFLNCFHRPTDIQKRAWPVIASGDHTLMTAPTGSGKTLTAFLWAIHQLAAGTWERGQTRVLYISPLKALNNDIRKNLTRPLEEINAGFASAELPFPDIRVLTRSGDTPQSDRRKMAIRPPEILITTPESLNLLLSSMSGRQMLTGLNTVILDEIHAVAATKRGVHLITAVDRLVRLSGEFQRIALSATVRDMDAMAGFVGGFSMRGSIRAPAYSPRRVRIIESRTPKHYDIRVRFPDKKAEDDDTVWDVLADTFAARIAANKATLFFTNGRRLCEKLTYKINRAAGRPVAYAHHGSLSKELRKDVETRLRNGELEAIVSTSSLELGIDIGDLTEVILVQSPPSVSAAIQRLGRAGHRVGADSRGSICPAHVQDLIPSAVLARAVDDRDLEALTPIRGPLDVLAQILVSMTGTEVWDMDELFAEIRTSYPFHDLDRDLFDLVLNMLAGRYSDTRIRELSPRVSIDRLDNTVSARKGALLALYMSGGTIPDRGYFKLRHQETNAVIGELDEEYVWEAKTGQIATIGTQNWKIGRITHNDVFALPVGNRNMDAPFWIAEGIHRDFHFSCRMGEFLESADSRLDDPAFLNELDRVYHLDDRAAAELVFFLKRQKDHTEAGLPHRHHLVLEVVRSGPGGYPGNMLVIHTLWGGRVNRPFALALEAAWTDAFGQQPEIFPGNDAVVVQLPHKVPPEAVLGLVTADNYERLLRRQLERSGFFGARFRESAGRALLVTRQKMGQRMPLWMTRLRSKKLLENVLKYRDFPILLETWRTCLKDEFDLPGLETVLAEVGSGAMAWTQVHTGRPSPFAAALAWNQINQYMYQPDQPASASSSLGSELVRDLVFTPDQRPVMPAQLIREFTVRRQRLAEGVAPASPRDLVDWVRERVAIPLDEWDRLMAVTDPDSQPSADNPAGRRLVCLCPAGTCLVVALEDAGRIRTAWYDAAPVLSLDQVPLPADALPAGPEPDAGNGTEALDLLAQWLRFYGPISRDAIAEKLGMDPNRAENLVEDLCDNRTLVAGFLKEGGTKDDICDAENFEILVRMNRAGAVPDVPALPVDHLPLFLAEIQGLAAPGGGSSDPVETVFQTLSTLACLPLPAAAWESDILPARLRPYYPAFLDTLMQEGDLLWKGCGREKIAFCFKPDLAFWDAAPVDTESGATAPGATPPDRTASDEAAQVRAASSEADADPVLDQAFSTPGAAHGFAELMGLTRLPSPDLAGRIWEQVWQGRLSNDTFMALRKGIETRFKISAGPYQTIRSHTTRSPARQPRTGRRSMGRAAFARRQGSAPLSGRFYRLESVADGTADLVDRMEQDKEKVRLLTDRYGILFRELLAREMPELAWSRIIRALVLMELAGEILSGYFFEGIPGPQFMSRPAFHRLRAGLSVDAVFWMSALDPASACGLALPGLKGFPRRIAANHLSFHGTKLVLVSRRNGREVDIFAEPDNPDLPRYFAPLAHLLDRRFAPKKSLTVDLINGADAANSPFAEPMETMFDMVREHRRLVLYRKRS